MHMRFSLSILFSLFAACASAYAQEAPPVEEAAEPAPPVAEEATQDADAPAPSVEMAVKVEMPELEEEAADYTALLDEMKALRQEFRQLQETLDLLVGQMMADVQNENLQLRHEVRRLADVNGAGPYVPGGSSQLLEQVLTQPLPPLPEADAEGEAEGEPAAPLKPAEPAVPAGPFEFDVLQEWGRSPEAAKTLGDSVPTLKGIVGIVPRGSARADLENLGRELRQKYDEYDNINIEVFDNEEAARLFAERQLTNSDSRVLSVSKERKSGRDVILYMNNGTTFEVTR